MVKMHKKLKQAWLEALRSGKYEQGQATLCSVRDDKLSYCCLGVLQMVADGDVERFSDHVSRDLPSPEWIAKKNIIMDTEDRWNTSEGPLYILNDRSESFEYIADLIEREVETHEDSPCSQK